MSEYSQVKIGKLKLKGEKTKKKHKSKKRKHRDLDEGPSKKSTDTADHGGWWMTKGLHEITGSVAIQIGESPMYVRAEDNGLFMVGPPHDEGDGPSPEEIITALPAGDGHLAFKSGYNKYLGVDGNGVVSGRADAIGPREMWTPVFQDGKCALSAANECFLGVDDDDNIVATSDKAGPGQMVIIRSSAIRECDKPKELPTEEQGKIYDVEMNYIKKFQKFQDKRTLVNTEDRGDLRKARTDGALHEALLDRRAKMKADRYCK